MSTGNRKQIKVKRERTWGNVDSNWDSSERAKGYLEQLYNYAKKNWLDILFYILIASALAVILALASGMAAFIAGSVVASLIFVGFAPVLAVVAIGILTAAFWHLLDTWKNIKNWFKENWKIFLARLRVAVSIFLGITAIASIVAGAIFLPGFLAIALAFFPILPAVIPIVAVVIALFIISFTVFALFSLIKSLYPSTKKEKMSRTEMAIRLLILAALLCVSAILIAPLFGAIGLGLLIGIGIGAFAAPLLFAAVIYSIFVSYAKLKKLVNDAWEFLVKHKVIISCLILAAGLGVLTGFVAPAIAAAFFGTTLALGSLIGLSIGIALIPLLVYGLVKSINFIRQNAISIFFIGGVIAAVATAIAVGILGTIAAPLIIPLALTVLSLFTMIGFFIRDRKTKLSNGKKLLLTAIIGLTLAALVCLALPILAPILGIPAFFFSAFLPLGIAAGIFPTFLAFAEPITEKLRKHAIKTALIIGFLIGIPLLILTGSIIGFGIAVIVSLIGGALYKYISARRAAIKAQELDAGINPEENPELEGEPGPDKKLDTELALANIQNAKPQITQPQPLNKQGVDDNTPISAAVNAASTSKKQVLPAQKILNILPPSPTGGNKNQIKPKPPAYPPPSPPVNEEFKKQHEQSIKDKSFPKKKKYDELEEIVEMTRYPLENRPLWIELSLEEQKAINQENQQIEMSSNLPTNINVKN